MNSSRSAASQLRKRNRSVSAIVSAIERCHSLDDRVDRFVDMLEVGAEAEDGAADVIAAVDARAAQHHPAFLLQMLEQPLVELVGIAVLRQVAESDDRQVGRRARVEAVDLRQPRVEVAGERQLLRLRGAERGDAGELQRQPQAQRAEMAGQLGRQIGGRRPDLGLAERPDVFGAALNASSRCRPSRTSTAPVP